MPLRTPSVTASRATSLKEGGKMRSACTASGLHTRLRRDYIPPRARGGLHTARERADYIPSAVRTDYIPNRRRFGFGNGWITYTPAAQLHTDRDAIGLHPPPLGVIWKRADLEPGTTKKEPPGGDPFFRGQASAFAFFLSLCSRILSEYICRSAVRNISRKLVSPISSA